MYVTLPETVQIVSFVSTMPQRCPCKEQFYNEDAVFTVMCNPCVLRGGIGAVNITAKTEEWHPVATCESLLKQLHRDVKFYNCTWRPNHSVQSHLPGQNDC